MSESTDKALTLVDRATRSLVTANNNINKSNLDLTAVRDELTKQVVELSTEIEFKQNEYDNLGKKFEIKLRESNADLALSIKENERTELKKLLTKNNLAEISITDLAQLRGELQSEKDSREAEIEAIKESEAKRTEATIASRVNTLTSNHKVEIAEINATIKSNASEIQSLKDQLKEAREALVEERKARVDIAKADATKQGVVVNTGK